MDPGCAGLACLRLLMRCVSLWMLVPSAVPVCLRLLMRYVSLWVPVLSAVPVLMNSMSHRLLLLE